MSRRTLVGGALTGLGALRIPRVPRADGGRSWIAAALSADQAPWAWRLWRGEIPDAGTARELLVRARDSAGLVQPPTVRWNAGGYQYNAWSRWRL